MLILLKILLNNFYALLYLDCYISKSSEMMILRVLKYSRKCSTCFIFTFKNSEMYLKFLVTIKDILGS